MRAQPCPSSAKFLPLEWDKPLDPGLSKSSCVSPCCCWVCGCFFGVFWEAGTARQHLSPVCTATSVIATPPASRASPLPGYNRDLLADPSQPEPSSFEISVAFVQLVLRKNDGPQRKFPSGSPVVPWQFECFSLFK